MPHNHHGIFHFFKNKELNELYASIALRAFAISLTGLFIPIYLYQLGYSFSSIFFFYAFSAFFNLIFSFPASKFASKFGLKHSILTSIPFLIIFFILLFTLENSKWPLWILAFFSGIHLALFWFSYHVDFSRFSNKKSRGTQVGISRLVIALASALGPLVGGVVLSFLSFKFLFAGVSIIMLLSAAPLFLSKEVHVPAKFSLKGFFKGQKIRDILTYIGDGIEIRLGLVAWPLFIFVFILNEKYISLGAVSSLAFATSLILTFVVSKFADINRKLVLKIGIIANSIVWIFKSFLSTITGVFIADALYGASRTSMHIPFDAINYDKAKKKNRAKIILQREVYIKIGAIIILVFLGFFSDYLIEAFRYLGPLASLMKWFF